MFSFIQKIEDTGNIRKILLIAAAFFLLLLSIILTLSPAVRYRTWDVNYKWTHWIGYIIWLVTSIILYNAIDRNLPSSDPFIFTIAQLLCGWGLITIWRLDPFFGFRQTLWLIICTTIAYYFLRNTSFLEDLKEFKYFWLILGLLLIGLTFFFGTYPGGSGPKLWLGFGNVFIQPSELLKIILIIYLASYFSEHPTEKFEIFKTIIPTIILAIASIALLIIQRDLGTALIFASIYLFMVFFAYGKKRIILFGGLILLITTGIGFLTIDLIRIRFLAWFFPWSTSQTTSYQIIQSIISIASGGLFGTGLGLGYPNLVPLSHSDFIFSAIVEESGLIGGIGLITLLIILTFRGAKTSKESKDRFYMYLSAGIITYFITQSILIIGGNNRLLPITGVTLPFISYGGSSLLVSYISLCILIIISNKEADPYKAEYKDSSIYKLFLVIFLFCFLLISLVLGWWAVVRESDIQERSDNSRNLISNIYVRRGDIVDRNNVIIAESIGIPGSYTRKYHYAPLSNTIGYIDQKYGKFGLEKAHDDYLRGIKGYPAHTLWLNYLLYDQPPDGRPIRLTIDLDIQRKVDDLMSNQIGAAVVLNATNGEILAISTSPHIDANQLDGMWAQWNADENAPFLNRASQGAYPIGGLLAPLILADSEIVFPYKSNMEFNFLADLNDSVCKSTMEASDYWQAQLSNGCVSGLIQLSSQVEPSYLFKQPQFSSLINSPEIGLNINPPIEISLYSNWIDIMFGSNKLRSNPLQIATSFAPLSNGGNIIQPSILSSVNISTGEWVVLSPEGVNFVLPNWDSSEIIQNLVSDSLDGWEISAVTNDMTNSYSWYVTGTGENWQNTPIVIALVIEKDHRNLAQYIGKNIFKSIIGD